MGVMDKFLDMMGFTETKEDYFDEDRDPVDEIQEWKPKKQRGHLVPFQKDKDQVKVMLIEPVTFDDCQHIADNLKNKRAVIINLENVDLHLARRIIDFVGGTAYALGGTLQKVGAGIVICLPNNMDISGDASIISQPKEIFAWINKIN